jgi:phosphatidyl-myo-inositol dimannoside synthase
MAATVAGRALAGVEIPPGVDVDRFRPLTAEERVAARARWGIDPERPMILGVSRLVPRKGFDVLLEASAALDESVQIVIAGAGRDRSRLERLARRHALAARARFLGRVPDADLPALYGCADVFAMCCRERWGGLEAEGFGIVFLEAAACGVPAVAGRSGGSHEAVSDGETGTVCPSRDVPATREALRRLLEDGALRRRMGDAARRRAVDQFSYDGLVQRLEPVARGDFHTFIDLAEQS